MDMEVIIAWNQHQITAITPEQMWNALQFRVVANVVWVW
jgi:hypothetical protein